MKIFSFSLSFLLFSSLCFETFGKNPSDPIQNRQRENANANTNASTVNTSKDRKVADLKKKHSRIEKIFNDWQQAVAKQNRKAAAALHQEYLREQQDFLKQWNQWEKEAQEQLKKAEKAIGNEAGKIQKDMEEASQDTKTK
ncbi:hypothetical protein [Methylacidiphilum kamchatkense]|uniref:Uncharacterized protein n=1 Tax=Methylacidiphilum kamchatkense Kam1 TaxID=1202785 RepID=A0A516TLW8_9BACT|nr:hypothetical protein [Methylacidiphilum kamchatkense]QDQ42237.1 hypothetical protein kam1_1005 [Methylacidiphilum kamchatkense Kam1]